MTVVAPTLAVVVAPVGVKPAAVSQNLCRRKQE